MRAYLRSFSNPNFILLLGLSLAFARSLPSQSLADFEKKVTEFTLPNGMHFIVVERHDAPVVAFNSYVEVGSVNDPAGKTGLAHMFEHMAFKGTPAIGSKDWPSEKAALEQVEQAYDAFGNEQNKGIQAGKQKLQQLRATVEKSIEKADTYVVPNLYPRIIEENGGVGLNAATAFDSTVYFYKFPSNRLELWFLLESQRFYAPVFREFYKERDVVREERRMNVESSPQGQLQETLLAAAFEAHPYHHTPGGWASDIERFRLKDAVAFYREAYVPSNIHIAIVGDVKPDQAKKLAEKYFSVIPSRPPAPPVHTEEPAQVGERRINVISASQPMELIAYKRPDQSSDDDGALEVLSDVLSSGRTGIIYKELVRDKQVALAAGAASTFPSGKYPNLFLLYAVPNTGKTLDDCERLLDQIVQRLKTEKIDAATLDRVKTNLRMGVIRRLESNEGLAQELNANYAALGDWRHLFTDLDRYDKVTADDVLRVAKKYLVPETRTIGRLVQPSRETQTSQGPPASMSIPPASTPMQEVQQ